MEPLSAVELESALVSMASNSVPSKTPTLSLIQMLLLNAVVFGVEICACAGFTYIPPMLLKAGYSEEEMSFILGFGPLLAFFLVPWIGRASDRCRSKFGRRRPFILGLSIILVVSMYVIPFGEYFTIAFLGESEFSHRLGLFFLTVGAVFLDFTSQACLTPCEAMLSDASRESHQHDRIFTIYSIMVSLGGVLGYLLTAIDWTTNSIGSYFGGQEASIFSMLIIIFTTSLTATLMTADEMPLTAHPASVAMIAQNDVPAAIEGVKVSSVTGVHGPATLTPCQIPILQSAQESGYESSSSDEDSVFTDSYLKERTRVFKSGNNRRTPKRFRSLQRFLTKLSVSMPSRSRFCSWTIDCLKVVLANMHRMLPKQIQQFFCVPRVLRYLALVNFCSWTSVMGFNLYFTDFVGQIVYNGNPNSPETTPEGHLYDEGVRMGSWGLLLHCLTSALYAMVVERLTETYGYRTTYLVGMTSFCFAMAGMVLVRNVVFVTLMAGLTGVAYATLTTVPFMLVTLYHTDRKLYFRDLPSSTTNNPEHGIGTDMATLDSAYFLSEVILTVVMGTVVHITGTVVSYMVTAGAFGLLACIFTQWIIVYESAVTEITVS